MIAGISMYQPSSAGTGGVHQQYQQHHPPTSLDATVSSASELVGYHSVVESASDSDTGATISTTGTARYSYDAMQQQMLHQQYMQQQLQQQLHPSHHQLYDMSSTAGAGTVGTSSGSSSFNTSAPPSSSASQQLYVGAVAQETQCAALSSTAETPSMTDLEQQFAESFRLQTAQIDKGPVSAEPNVTSLNHELVDSVTASGTPMNDDSETNDALLLEQVEGEDSEEEPVKLFVGQIPKAMNEEDVFPTFDSFGPLKDVSVIRDKHSGLHRGCAFVTYWSAIDAERARQSLHDIYTFPGAKRPAQVKLAEPSAVLESKLFIGMLSRESDEQIVYDLFSQFGEIIEVYMIRNPDGSSKCAAFLRFATRESAVVAIEQLNGVEVMEGVQRPLIVKFADNKLQRQQRQIRNVRRHEMMTMVGPGGYPFPPPGASIAMAMHHPSATGAPYAMPPTTQVYGAAVYGTPAAHAPPTHHHNPYMYPSPYGQVPPYAAYQHHQQQQHQQQQARQEPRSANPRPREGPSGANLFVYHLPHDLTDADLATAFNPFGSVISAKVYVDKFTGESKGFGFVSYDSVLAAEQAIEQMNGFQIGNKRLKVQHKRVHGGTFSSPQVDSQSPPSSENNSATGLPGPSIG